MTRINVIPPRFLPTKYLIAEYHELPRCIKQKMDVGDEWDKPYHLGKGHMKWARAHSAFLMERYYHICGEMLIRGINMKYRYSELLQYAIDHGVTKDEKLWNDYNPKLSDLFLNLERIKENEKETQD